MDHVFSSAEWAALTDKLSALTGGVPAAQFTSAGSVLTALQAGIDAKTAAHARANAAEDKLLDELHDSAFLTKDQIHQVNNILDRTPAAALPGSGFGGRVKTFDDVVKALISVSDYLKRAMSDNIDMREQREQEARDMAAVGRVLARFTEASNNARVSS
jgi:GMP synthase PP-ATPase subunit